MLIVKKEKYELEFEFKNKKCIHHFSSVLLSKGIEEKEAIMLFGAVIEADDKPPYIEWDKNTEKNVIEANVSSLIPLIEEDILNSSYTVFKFRS
jgi:hypothetical protein